MVRHNNANRMRRILTNFFAYGRMSINQIRSGLSPYEIARGQFPALSPRPKKPTQVTIEFTNHCNLKCVYCCTTLGLRETGMMEAATFTNVFRNIKQLGINRVRIVGGGEPTLHPEFGAFMEELARATKYVSVLSNGKWKNPGRVIEHLLLAPVDLIEVSVEGTTKEAYERSSVRGNFEFLLDNLKALKAERDRRRLRSMINLRVMMRPSDVGRKSELKKFWGPYCDTMLLQRLIQFSGLEDVEDLFRPAQRDEQKYPHCSIPFKAMEVNWDGSVPLCCYSVVQSGPPGFIVGNVNQQSLKDIWNGDVFSTYRRGHRERDPGKMPICKGCSAV